MRLVRPVPVTVANLTSDVAQPETLWNIGTTYGAAAAVYEVISGVPMGFVSKAGGNLAHRPSEDLTETYWEPRGPTNRWAMFDGTIQTQTIQAEQIEAAIQLDIDESVDTVRLANISAETARVRVTDSVDGVVYDQTFDLTSNVGIDDYLPWFSEPIVRLAGKTISGLPALYPGALITVTLEAPGEDVACGLCLPGFSRTLGGTKWGSELGFRDLSVKGEDDFGGAIVVERPFKRTASFNVITHASVVDEVQRLFEQYRATPILVIGNDDYDTMAIYGFVKSFKQLVNWPTRSLCTVDMESLA